MRGQLGSRLHQKKRQKIPNRRWIIIPCRRYIPLEGGDLFEAVGEKSLGPVRTGSPQVVDAHDQALAFSLDHVPGVQSINSTADDVLIPMLFLLVSLVFCRSWIRIQVADLSPRSCPWCLIRFNLRHVVTLEDLWMRYRIPNRILFLIRFPETFLRSWI